MYLIKLILMIHNKQWLVLGKHNLKYLHLILYNRFNATHIPKTDDTLNATSRRYGTKTDPFTHPATIQNIHQMKQLSDLVLLIQKDTQAQYLEQEIHK